MALTKIQPSGLDATLDYSVHKLTVSGVDVLGYAQSAFLQANTVYDVANTLSPEDTFARTQANAAFTQANTGVTNAATANTNAAIADDKAVTAGSYANAAFSVANTAYGWGNHASVGYATTGFVTSEISNLIDNAPGALDTLNELAAALGDDANFSTTITNMVSVTGSYANSAFVQANTANTNAATADSKAVTAGSYANSAYTQANTATTNALAANSYANSAFATANTNATNITALQGVNDTQNTNITTANTNAATADSKAVTAGSYANSAFVQANTATTNAATADDKAVTAGSYANSAFAQANTATTNAATADDKAVSAGSYANAAFAQANTDYTTLSTTSGVYGGSADIPVITLAANGRVSSITNTAISIPAGTSVYGNTGQITANVATGTVALGLATTAVTPGVYGDANNTVTITVDEYGRVTALSNNAISVGGGGGGGATLSAVAAATTYYIGLSATDSGTWTDARVDTSNLYYSSATSTLYSTNFNTSSDENLKSSIETILNALDTVNLLRGVSFLWKSNGLKSYGVIAQELEKIIPDLVTTDANGRKTVNYNALIGFLIEAIKTQSTQIQSLEERITRLEEK